MQVEYGSPFTLYNVNDGVWLTTGFDIWFNDEKRTRLSPVTNANSQFATILRLVHPNLEKGQIANDSRVYIETYQNDGMGDDFLGSPGKSIYDSRLPVQWLERDHPERISWILSAVVPTDPRHPWAFGPSPVTDIQYGVPVTLFSIKWDGYLNAFLDSPYVTIQQPFRGAGNPDQWILVPLQPIYTCREDVGGICVRSFGDINTERFMSCRVCDVKDGPGSGRDAQTVCMDRNRHKIYATQEACDRACSAGIRTGQTETLWVCDPGAKKCVVKVEGDQQPGQSWNACNHRCVTYSTGASMDRIVQPNIPF